MTLLTRNLLPVLESLTVLLITSLFTPFKSCLLLLNNLTIFSLLNSSHTLMITDTSIKNNVTTFIAHIYICKKDVIKMIYHTVNVLSSEAELFAIRCSINQATNVPGILKIVVITDLLHAAWRIFNSSLHLYQIHIASISNKLRRFFINNNNNSIKFWECPSHCE